MNNHSTKNLKKGPTRPQVGFKQLQTFSQSNRDMILYTPIAVSMMSIDDKQAKRDLQAVVDRYVKKLLPLYVIKCKVGDD